MTLFYPVITDALREIMDSNMDMIHEFRPDLPEECTFPMERSLNLHRFVLTLPTMKPFEDWVYSRGHQYYKDMYSFQRKTLQMIGYKGVVYIDGLVQERRNYSALIHRYHLC